MNRTVKTLQQTRLFYGLGEREILAILAAEGVEQRAFRRGAVVICEGDDNNRIGVILSGSVTAERVFPDGEVATASVQGVGGIIGDVLSGSSAKSPVTVIAASETEIVFFPLSIFIRPDASLAAFQPRLVENLIMGISNKYFELEHRTAILSSGNLRRKIMLYLCAYCRKAPNQTFYIDHSREQQAAYLGCERTALSRELAKMRKEGLIDYRGNRFTVQKDSHICRMLEEG